MSKKKQNPGVSIAFCNERHSKFAELINVKLQNIETDIKEIKDNSKAWKNWLLGIVGSILGSVITAYLLITFCV